MSPMLTLLVCLVLARGMGTAAHAIRLPSSVGEITAGILLVAAASVFADNVPFLTEIVENNLLSVAANIAIFFIVLNAGIEMEPRQIMEYSAKAMIIACCGVAVPLIGGVALSWYLLEGSDQRELQALVTGVVLSVTALPVVVKILTEQDMLRSAVGETIVAAALFDDIITLILFALLLAIVETGSLPSFAEFGFMLVKIVAFFALTGILGAHVYPHVRKGLKTLQAASMEFSALIMTALAYGWLADIMSLHWVIGAFMAGLFFEKSQVGIRSFVQLRANISTFVQGILGPLFFLSIGLYVDLGALTSNPMLLVLLILFAIASKFVGAGGAARLLSFNRRDSSIIGILMTSRGVVALVILDIVYDAGIFSADGAQEAMGSSLLSTLIVVIIATTVLAPLLLQLVLARNK